MIVLSTSQDCYELIFCRLSTTALGCTTLWLFVWDDDTLPASETVVDVARQLVFTADEMRRCWVVLVQLAGRGVVRAARHHLRDLLRLDVDGQRTDQAAVRHARPPARPYHRRRTRGTEAYGTRAAHTYVQLTEPLRVLHRQTDITLFSLGFNLSLF